VSNYMLLGALCVRKCWRTLFRKNELQDCGIDPVQAMVHGTFLVGSIREC